MARAYIKNGLHVPKSKQLASVFPCKSDSVVSSHVSSPLYDSCVINTWILNNLSQTTICSQRNLNWVLLVYIDDIPILRESKWNQLP